MRDAGDSPSEFLLIASHPAQLLYKVIYALREVEGVFFLPCSLFLNAWVHSSGLKTLLGNLFNGSPSETHSLWASLNA